MGDAWEGQVDREMRVEAAAKALEGHWVVQPEMGKRKVIEAETAQAAALEFLNTSAASGTFIGKVYVYPLLTESIYLTEHSVKSVKE